MKRTLNGYWFYGNEVSGYGCENHRVDYATLAKAFDAVMCNSIMDNRYFEYEDWVQINGKKNHDEAIADVDRKIDVYEYLLYCADDENEKEKIESDLQNLYDEQNKLIDDEYDLPDVFQYFIISENGAEILKNWTEELVWYNAELDMYVWGVTHFGTGWAYVLTDIEIDVDEE